MLSNQSIGNDLEGEIYEPLRGIRQGGLNCMPQIDKDIEKELDESVSSDEQSDGDTQPVEFVSETDLYIKRDDRPIMGKRKNKEIVPKKE